MNLLDYVSGKGGLFINTGGKSPGENFFFKKKEYEAKQEGILELLRITKKMQA